MALIPIWPSKLWLFHFHLLALYLFLDLPLGCCCCGWPILPCKPILPGLAPPPLAAAPASLLRKTRVRPGPLGDVTWRAAALPRRLLTDPFLWPGGPPPAPLFCRRFGVKLLMFCLLPIRLKFLCEFVLCNCPPLTFGAPPLRLCPMRFAILDMDDVRLNLPPLNWSVTL